MKQLITAAAVVAFAAATQAGIVVNTNCLKRSSTCPVVAFKVTANGKIAAPDKKEIYKTTAKLQVKKGALVIFAGDGGTYNPATKEQDCCYDYYSLYLNVKVGKLGQFPVGVFYENIDSWSIYGKGFNKVYDSEKSKKGSVESEIGLSYANTSGAANGIGTGGSSLDNVTDSSGIDALDLGMGLQDFAFIATAFGKGSYGYTNKELRSGCNTCSTSEYYEFTPKSYSGWFAGLVSDFGGDYGCLMCNCADIDVFGGTWKAKYSKEWSKTADGWQKAAAYAFGSAALAQMLSEGIE